MALRFEVWTRPESGTFVRRFPLKDDVQYSLSLGLFGQGLLVVPSEHPRLADLLSVDLTDRTLDKGSLIRAYWDDTHLYDWYAARMSVDYNETDLRQATITGPGPGAVLDRTLVLPYDYPATPTLVPSHIYGPANTLLTNAGFEDGLPDEDFEDLNLGGWSELGGSTLDATEDGMEVWGELLWDISASPSSPITGAYSLQIPFPGTPPAGVSRTIDVIPNAQVRVRYNFEEPTGNGDRFLMFAADPDEGTIPTILSTNGWIYNGVGFVELDGAARFAGASDGTTQTFDIEVTCGPNQTRLQIGCQNATTSTHTNPGYLDDGVYTGDGLGLAPWFAHRNDYQIMELDSTFKRTGDSSLKFQTTSMADDEARDGPTQYVFCEVGAQYDESAWIYQASGLTHYFRVGMKRRGSGWTAGLVDVAVPTATWTKIGCNGVADQEAYEFTIRWVNATGGPSASPVFWVDDCSMGPGAPASTYGLIMGDLLDDAGTDHAPTRTALAWLTRTFTDTLDTNTDAWDQDISAAINRGQSLRRVVTFHGSGFGYQADIHPNASDDTIIEFDLFNPGAMGTDRTTGDGGAITGVGVVSVGPIIRREPRASYTFIEGADQWWGEARDTDLETAWGEIETYQGSVERMDASLADVATELLASDTAETVVVSFQDPPLIPGKDYKIGDLVTLILGDDLVPSGSHRVAAIGIQSGDPSPLFQVQFTPEVGV